jgi:cell division protein FtsW
VNVRHLIPWGDPSISEWAWEARTLRWLTFLWLFVGLAVMFSASYPSASAELGDGLYYFKRQLLWAGVGLVGFNLVVRTPLSFWLRISHWGVLVLMGLVWLTMIPGLGITANGATRWLSVGSVPIQPSELLKPFLVLQGARLFGRWDRLPWAARVTWLVILVGVLLGILVQPHLSTTALCGMMLWLMALAAGLPYRYLGITALSGLGLAIASLSVKEYQRRRVMSFLNPWADADGDGYQLIQSLLAVGSGGTWGTGFGQSQQKLFYLPIQYSDFIFAVFAEEFGLIGSLLLLLLLASYATLALRVAIRTSDRVYQLVAIGIMVLMVGQSLLNIGVTIGVLPTTGLPLPLFSYGGSSMVASLLAAGLLVRVARESGRARVLEFSRPRRNRQRTPQAE